jgi:hypothetical protein
MGLYLSCGLCGRKQADGLLSRTHWGHLESAEGQALRACPSCKGQHADWDARLLQAVGGGAPTFGATYGSDQQALVS